MSLSPFDSFQSRFVTYLLNFPRIIKLNCVPQKFEYWPCLMGKSYLALLF